MDMLIGGKHISSEDLVDVENPFTGEVIDTVPIAHRQTAQLAIDAANDAKESLVEMSAFKISNKLLNAVAKLEERREEFAQLLCQEVGKPINEALVEVDRSIETLRLAAEEAKRIYGESVPLDAGLRRKQAEPRWRQPGNGCTLIYQSCFLSSQPRRRRSAPGCP